MRAQCNSNALSDFMGSKKMTPRQAFFANFSAVAKEHIKRLHPHNGSPVPVILLTGGLRSPAHLQTALNNDHADLLGIGRGSILCPDLPAILQRRGEKVDAIFDAEPFVRELDNDIKLPFWFPKVPLVGASAGVSWYAIQMRKIAETETGRVVSLANIGAVEAMLRMWIWLDWAYYSCISSVVLIVTFGIYLLYC